MSYRVRLDGQFLSSGQQAIEKYLNAILLYHEQSALELGLDLERALTLIDKNIKDIEFNLPDDVWKFIEYLNVEGPNRYLQTTRYLCEGALQRLDRSVSFVRRYCQYLGATPHAVNKIHNPRYEERPHTFRFFDGFLENTMDKRT